MAIKKHRWIIIWLYQEIAEHIYQAKVMGFAWNDAKPQCDAGYALLQQRNTC